MSIPSFSIVIPTFQRPQQLKRCLAAAAKIDYPHDKFEVIVVNDGGDDFPEDIAASLNPQINVTILRLPHVGLAEARNFGARSAKNDFLAFLDDDCEPDVDWLRVLSSQFILTPRHLLGGRTVNALKRNIFSATSQLLVDYLYDYAARENPDFTFFTGNNLALSRAGYFEIGGFDKTFPVAAGEDRDLCCRWRENKGECRLVKEALVRHYHRLNFKSLWRQHFNYGRGSFHFRRQRADRLAQSVTVEPLSFYLRLFMFPFYQTSIPRALTITFLFFFTQLANTLGFLSESLSYLKFSSKRVLCFHWIFLFFGALFCF